MTTLVRLSLALSIACWMPNTTLANPRSASIAIEQQTPTPQTTTDKQPNPSAKPTISRPNPDPSGNYHMGDGITAPKLLSSVEPEFSEKARKKKLGGVCIVSLTVDTDGNPKDIKITKSIADSVDKKLRTAALGLDENCVKAVRQYRFQPATYYGKLVPFGLAVEVNFQIF